MLNVGDLVTLKPESVWASPGSDYNPVGLMGCISSTDEQGSLNIRVKWPKGENTYNDHDLILHKELETVEDC